MQTNSKSNWGGKVKKIKLTIKQRSSAKRIKAMRESAGLTKERFASVLHTTLNTVHRWERGAIPSAVWQRELDRFEKELTNV